MKNSIVMYFSTLLTFLAIDIPWLYVMGKKVYSIKLGHLLSENPQLLPALIFYLIYPVGILFFVLNPAIKDGWNVSKVAFMGALLGLIAYGTYDLTNNATLKDWPFLVTVIDIVWGMLLTSIVSIFVFWVVSKIKQ